MLGRDMLGRETMFYAPSLARASRPASTLGGSIDVRGTSLCWWHPSAVSCPSVIAPQLIASFERAQFDYKTGRLDCIHAAIPADHGMVILLYLAMIAKNADFVA